MNIKFLRPVVATTVCILLSACSSQGRTATAPATGAEHCGHQHVSAIKACAQECHARYEKAFSSCKTDACKNEVQLKHRTTSKACRQPCLEKARADRTSCADKSN